MDTITIRIAPYLPYNHYKSLTKYGSQNKVAVGDKKKKFFVFSLIDDTIKSYYLWFFGAENGGFHDDKDDKRGSLTQL